MDKIFSETQTNGTDIFLPKLPELFWSLLVIIILAILFYKYVLPHLNKTLDKRGEKIEGQIRDATAMNQAAQTAKAEYEKRLSLAGSETRVLKQTAKKDADFIINEAKAKAAENTSKALEAAQKTIQANKMAAFVALKKDIGVLASDFASQIVQEKVKPNYEQLKSIDLFLDNLEKNNLAEKESYK
ncbi:MAG: F0F1 ATP synthase subunit B [Bifidobacteriaceae bacterium]|jgi:F-type H+-transporting ATPase subunit b|nr:F0F1 ATP synthase subunit B [Bifidobacteriaceae bacterium]